MKHSPRTMGKTMTRLRSRATTPLLGVTVLLAAVASTGVARAGDLPSTADAPSQERPTSMAEARKQFQAGVNLLDDPDGAKYEEAYSAFKKAYELSQSPKVLGNIGFCAMHLERDGEAIDAYTSYLNSAPDVPERERAQIVRDLATMSSTIARVRVVVRRPSAHYVLVDTRGQTRGPSVENAYPFDGTEITVRVRPGRHTFKIKTDHDEESVPVDASLEPAALVAHELHFAPPKPATPAPTIIRQSPSVAGPVLVGVTGVLAIGGGVAMGMLARNKTDAIEKSCPNDVCPPEYDLASTRGSAKTFATMADVGLIGGGSLVAGALLWYALLPSARVTTTATASAMCTQTGCAVQLQRGF